MRLKRVASGYFGGVPRAQAFASEEQPGRALAAKLVRQGAQDKALALLCEVRDPLLVGHGQLLVDPQRLSPVLINLLGNAVKFTPAGQVALSVDNEALRAKPGDPTRPGPRRCPRISVNDTGIGMRPAQCEALFCELVPADVSNTRRFGDAGLGLAIGKRLADLVGGRIEVRSPPGAGTICTLHIAKPLLPAGLRRLRQRVEPHRLPILAMTAHVVAADQARRGAAAAGKTTVTSPVGSA